jgi:hypothetical protein
MCACGQASAGEIPFPTKDSAMVYEAATDDTEVVYVTCPHWIEARMRSEYVGSLEAYRPV